MQKIFNLSTHLVIQNNRKGFGPFIGKVKLNKYPKDIFPEFNKCNIDNIPIVGLEFIGTTEEIMKQVSLLFALLLAKAELEDNRETKSKKAKKVSSRKLLKRRDELLNYRKI